MEVDPVYGGNFIESLASYDLATSSWRTSQRSLLGGLSVFSGTWPRAGTMRAGTAYRRRPSAPLTGVTESSLWPTPRAGDGERGGRGELLHYVKTGTARAAMWPTPTQSDGMGGPGCSGRDGGENLRTAVKTLPTPRASDADRGGKPLGTLPTPDANCWKGGNRRGQITDPAYGITPNGAGQLSPGFVEWLMGFPRDWTKLEE